MKRKTWALGSRYWDVSVCKQVGRAANKVRVGIVFFLACLVEEEGPPLDR